MFWQTVQAKLSPLLEEQSYQVRHCLAILSAPFVQISLWYDLLFFILKVIIDCNDPKFSDRLIWANSADPDQTAPRGAIIPFASF